MASRHTWPVLLCSLKASGRIMESGRSSEVLLYAGVMTGAARSVVLVMVMATGDETSSMLVICGRVNMVHQWPC